MATAGRRSWASLAAAYGAAPGRRRLQATFAVPPGKTLYYPQKTPRFHLGTVQLDRHLPRLMGVEPARFPRRETHTVQKPPCHIPQAAEQLPERTPRLCGQPPQQAATLQQLQQQKGDLEQQVLDFPLLRAGAVDLFQIQAAVLLAVEPLIWARAKRVPQAYKLSRANTKRSCG